MIRTITIDELNRINKAVSSLNNIMTVKRLLKENMFYFDCDLYPKHDVQQITLKECSVEIPVVFEYYSNKDRYEECTAVFTYDFLIDRFTKVTSLSESR